MGLLTAAIAAMAGCNPHHPNATPAAALQVVSPAFPAGGALPAVYTAKGGGAAPPLRWSTGPAGVKSYALYVYDPDAPSGPFIHWLVTGIPATTTSITSGALPAGAVQGRNSAGATGWSPPDPPPGPAHHYHFRVLALDAVPAAKPGGSRRAIEAAMRRHVMAEGEMVATFGVSAK